MPGIADINNGTGRIFLYDELGTTFIASSLNEGPNFAFRQCIYWLMANYPHATVWINAGYGPNSETDKGPDAVDITSDVNTWLDTVFAYSPPP